MRDLRDLRDLRERGLAIRASATIPWSDIQPPAGRDLDLGRLVARVRLAWRELYPEIARGSRFLLDLTSAREVRVTLSDSAPPFGYLELRGDMDRMWTGFLGYVATSLVYMAHLNAESHPDSHLGRDMRDLLDLLARPVEDPLDPLEDAEEDGP